MLSPETTPCTLALPIILYTLAVQVLYPTSCIVLDTLYSETCLKRPVTWLMWPLLANEAGAGGRGRVREGVGEGKLGWKREGGAREGKGEEIKWDESLSGEGKSHCIICCRQEQSSKYTSEIFLYSAPLIDSHSSMTVNACS